VVNPPVPAFGVRARPICLQNCALAQEAFAIGKNSSYENGIADL